MTGGFDDIDRRGWLPDIEHVPSPNFDLRPPPGNIDLIVVHGISLPPGRFGGRHIDALFTNTLDPAAHPYFSEIKDLRVSCHFLIRRDAAIAQFVSVFDRAWHAGRSRYAGRAECNDYSIGIELEGTDEDPCTEPQFERLVGLCAVLRRTYPAITASRIVGHCDVAPERKTDPGPCFDWERLRRRITLE